MDLADLGMNLDESGWIGSWPEQVPLNIAYKGNLSFLGFSRVTLDSIA